MLLISFVWDSKDMTITSDLLAKESTLLRVFDVAGRELYIQDFLILKGTYFSKPLVSDSWDLYYFYLDGRICEN
jgi:hypothetical protein